MHSGTYVFQQITSPFKRQFNRIVSRYDDRTKGWAFTHWNFLCVLIFGQLSGCSSLRELVDIMPQIKVLEMDCWRALTELDAKAKDYEEIRALSK